MKQLVIFLASASVALANPLFTVAGAPPPVQNYCQLTMEVRENLPRITYDPRARINLKIKDKGKYMEDKMNWPKWTNKDNYDMRQPIGPGEKFKITLNFITVGNNTLDLSWEQTADVDSDYMLFKYYGSDGKLWRQWRDTDENRGDSMDNYIIWSVMRSWEQFNGSVKPHCERTKWHNEDENTRLRYLICAFKC